MDGCVEICTKSSQVCSNLPESHPKSIRSVQIHSNAPKNPLKVQSGLFKPTQISVKSAQIYLKSTQVCSNPPKIHPKFSQVCSNLLKIHPGPPKFTQNPPRSTPNLPQTTQNSPRSPQIHPGPPKIRGWRENQPRKRGDWPQKVQFEP